jgi:hypothetical protein
MTDREPTIIRRLLDRLLAARARRDREERFSEPWQAADTELRTIERAIFALPVERPPSRLTQTGSLDRPRHGRRELARFGSR